ncbi:MAG: helix-turn-helix transcriptional regulator [Clostridiales bacterium]|nr:helix-turn-helix transcriptional regulator [Clostridiales bacterium]
MDQKKIGNFLKELRTEKNLTQAQLAEQFGVTNRSVSRWETGSNLPDISLIVEIADFYGVDVREIIDGERKRENMDKDIKEVADKMADYAKEEKSKHLTAIQILSILCVVALLIATTSQLLSFSPDIGNVVALLCTLAGLALTFVIALYVLGVLKKIKNNKPLITAITIVTVTLVSIGILQVIGFAAIFAFLLFDVASSKIQVYDDPYDVYVMGKSGKDIFLDTPNNMFYIFPEEIPEEEKITEYQLTYYNPWDPQYIAYMTVEYTPEEYASEMERLSEIGIEKYTGYYTVTDEPAGYDLVAMHSDEYQGFVYAMIPEGAGEDNTTITYVGIWFCNYVMDLDYTEYIPNEYLLTGFDATDENPYEIERLGTDEEMLKRSFTLQ